MTDMYFLCLQSHLSAEFMSFNGDKTKTEVTFSQANVKLRVHSVLPGELNQKY